MALCQLAVTDDKQRNIATARTAIDEAAGAGAGSRWADVLSKCWLSHLGRHCCHTLEMLPSDLALSLSAAASRAECAAWAV